MKKQYDEFLARNLGYIHENAQKRISECHVLNAGRGVGSQLAISAARMGFQNSPSSTEILSI